jgi:hypothetical protein
MKSLILTIAVFFISMVSFSQMQGMDNYKQSKKFKFKDGVKGVIEGDKNYIYFFSSQNSMDHSEEVLRIVESNGIDFDNFDVNSTGYLSDGAVFVFNTFVSEKDLVVSVIYVYSK